jgi:hypothetical protein
VSWSDRSRRASSRTQAPRRSWPTQVGEFSFILATLGLSLGLIPGDAFQFVVAAALVSITLNPFVFRLVEPVERRIAARPDLVRLLQGAPLLTSGQAGVAETALPERVPYSTIAGIATRPAPSRPSVA